MKCRSSREDDWISRGKDGQLPAQGRQDAESVALLNALPDAIRGFYAGQGDAREFAGWLTLIGAVVLLSTPTPRTGQVSLKKRRCVTR